MIKSSIFLKKEALVYHIGVYADTNEQLAHFGVNFQSLFLFFPNRHTLKFLKIMCNPTNKKNCRLT